MPQACPKPPEVADLRLLEHEVPPILDGTRPQQLAYGGNRRGPIACERHRLLRLFGPRSVAAAKPEDRRHGATRKRQRDGRLAANRTLAEQMATVDISMLTRH